MQFASTMRWRWLLPVILLIALFHLSPFADAFNRGFFDAVSRHPLFSAPLPNDTALVLVDEYTMTEMGEQGLRWPFPRLVFAQLIAALQQAGARKVLVDFTFFEQSDAMQDQVLAAVAAGAPSVVLARTVERRPVFWPQSFVQDYPEYFGVPRTGNVEFPADDDGVARRYPLPGSLVAAADGGPAVPAGDLLFWHGGLEQLREKGIPVLSAAPYISAGRPILEHLVAAAPDLDVRGLAGALATAPVLSGALAAAVQDKVVFVGANASGTFDVKPMAIGQVEPALLLHWTAWSNLMAGTFIASLGWLWVLAVTTAAGSAVLFSGLKRSSLAAPVGTALAMGALVLCCSYVLHYLGWWLGPATPMAGVVLVLLGVVAENLWREQARKRAIQATFGAYVDPAVVARLIDNPDSIPLRGERREATVFFSDLAGFTELSEKLPAEQMVEVVNAYLDATSECLHRHGAYVDKYIGDAVMAVFGVPQELPDHALAACLAALDTQQALDEINARYAARVGVELAVRIGLNTGELLAGNVGSSRKMNYTVMGDVVNLASRLEGANKYFGTGILIGEETARLVGGRLLLRPLGRLRVKGKQRAVEVFTLHGDAASLQQHERDFVDQYRAGYEAWVQRRFVDAREALARALELFPGDQRTLDIHREAEYYSSHPPPPEWEPIVSLDAK